MINYNNLSFIHYLNLEFESTQQECRKFQSPFSARSQLLYSWSHASYRKEGARYALIWNNHRFQTSNGFWLGFFPNHTVLQWVKLNSTWDFAFFTLVDENQRSSAITHTDRTKYSYFKNGLGLPHTDAYRHICIHTYICPSIFQYYLASCVISQELKKKKSKCFCLI